MPTARRVRVALFVCQLIAAITLLAYPWSNASAQPQSPPPILSVEPRPSRSTFNAINGLTTVRLQSSRALQTPANSIRVWDRGSELPSNLYTVTPGSTPTELVIQFNPRVMYGRLTIVLTPAVTDANGASLDGECLDPFQPTLPSGDGRAGGDFVLQYDVLAGDFNHDRCVGISDLADFLNALFNNDFAADVNNSGLVNVQDIFEFLGAFLTNQSIAMTPLDGGRPVAASFTPPESGTLRTDLAELQVTFSEPVGNLLLGASTIFLSDEAGLVYRPSTASLAADRLSATFTFAPGVPQCHRYRVSLSNTIQDLSGEPLLASTPTPELTGLRPPPSPALDSLPRSTTANTISISGIADAGVQIEVAGPGGMVSGPVTGSGAFAVELPLVANRVNSLFVSSVSTCGIRSAPTPIAVAQDTQAPTLAIDFPSPNAQIQAIGTDVAGRVGDLLSGFQGLTVTVNGQPAAVNVGNVDNGTFFFPSLLLNDAVPTQIQVVARDALGNTATRTISVSKRIIPPGAPRMEIFSGNGQSATVGSPLPSPVIIRMLRGDGTSFSGKVVTFSVTRSDGQLAGTSGAPGGLVYQTITDAGGFARVYWTLGSDAGSGNNRVEVTSRDIAGTIQLCASGIARPARQINFGDAMSLNQIGEAGAALPVPLSVFVSDGQNGSGGVPVTFQVIRGGGGFGSPSSASITVDTDPSGRASAIFTLGTEGGQNEVEATFPGNPGLPVVFTARGLVRETDAPTTFVGELFDNAGRPIGGCPVTLSVNGVNATPGVTGLDGRFTISQGLIGGTGTIMFVADQATQLSGQPIPAGSFPIMAYDNVLVVPNTENSLAMAVRLPQLNPNNRRTYDGTQDVILGIEGVEGVAFKIRAGTVVRTPAGVTASPSTPVTLSLDQVHFDEVPMPLPNGAAIPFAWTLQPKNATFDPPIEVTLPNFAALPRGSVTYIQQFNHIVGGFENVGAARVSDDASVVVSDPGAGIYQAGWGGSTPPPPPMTELKKCQPNSNGCGPSPVGFWDTVVNFIVPEGFVYLDVDGPEYVSFATHGCDEHDYCYGRLCPSTTREGMLACKAQCDVNLFVGIAAGCLSELQLGVSQAACLVDAYIYYQAVSRLGEDPYLQGQDEARACADSPPLHQPPGPYIEPPFPDADSDGMDDDWERMFGLNPSDWRDTFADPDGDDVSNFIEFAMHYNPRNAHSTSPTVDDWEAVASTFPPRVPSIDSTWDIAIGNVRVLPDSVGRFVATVPATDLQYRIRARRDGGRTGVLYAASNTVSLTTNPQQITAFDFSPLPFPVPQSLTLSAPATPILVNTHVSLQVAGTMSDGTQSNLTTSAGTDYLVSDRTIVDVAGNGVATALRPGTAFVIAVNEGATATRRLVVAQTIFQQTIEGVVQTVAGQPVVGATISTVEFGGLATTGSDGRFSLALELPGDTTSISLVAAASFGGQSLSGVGTVSPVRGQIADAGIIVVQSTQQTIQGFILNVAGQPISGARVSSVEFGNSTTTGQDGLFVLTLDLPSGTSNTSIVATATVGGQGVSAVVAVPIVAGQVADAGFITLRTGNPVVLALRIVPQDGLPASGANPPSPVVDQSDTRHDDIVVSGQSRRFEVQYRIIDLDPNDNIIPAGLTAGQMSITAAFNGASGSFGRALLSRFEAQEAAGVPPTPIDPGGATTGALAGARGMHRPFRGGIPAPSPNNLHPSNGTLTATGITGISPLVLSQPGQNALNGWYGLYSFDFVGTGGSQSENGPYVTFTAVFVADPGTGNRFAYFNDGQPVPVQSANTVSGTAQVRVGIPPP